LANQTIKERIGEGNQRWRTCFFLSERRPSDRHPEPEACSKAGFQAERRLSYSYSSHALGPENRYLLMPKYNRVQSKQQHAAWESGSAWAVAFGRSRSGGSAILMM
jgi:hypothetical protein